MSYPQYFNSVYINPSGNITASGYFKSHITQELANMYPYWTAIRDNENSNAQQYMSPMARKFYDLESKLSQTLNDKFIDVAPVDEIDVIYRMKIPSTISYLNNPNIECWTSPSGVTPSGYPFPEPSGGNSDTFNSIRISEIGDLEEFYYHVLPTRFVAFNSEPYSDSRISSLDIEFPVKPSGILDPNSRYISKWKKEHEISWANTGMSCRFLKQDSDTKETYREYIAGASGVPKGFSIHKDNIWWIGHDISLDKYFINISNSHPSPDSEYLDTLAVCDITNLFSGHPSPSGIDIDEEGHIWILDENRTTLYAFRPMYDYFLVDKESRFVFFREDYSDPGVFVKPA